MGGRFHFLSLGSDSPGITLFPDNRDNLAALGFFAGYDSRDFWTNPHRGWWNEVEVSRNFWDGDFWTFNIDFRRFQPLAGRHTLAFFSLTTLQTGTVGEELPLHQDFHLVGTNSVRGWGLDSTRGKNQFINTIEYRYQWVPPRALKVFGFNFYLGVQLALFGDFGLAWDDRSEDNLRPGDSIASSFCGCDSARLRLRPTGQWGRLSNWDSGKVGHTAPPRQVGLDER